MISSHLAVQDFKREVGCLQSVYRYHIVVGSEVNDKVFVVFGYDRKWPFVMGGQGWLACICANIHVGALGREKSRI